MSAQNIEPGAQTYEYESCDRKLIFKAEKTFVSFELIDYINGVKYFRVLLKTAKTLEVLPPILIDKTIKSLLDNKKYSVSTDAKSCKIVLFHEYMNEPYDIDVDLDKAELDTQTQLLADNKKLLAKVHALEEKLNQSFLCELCSFDELKIDWVDFHQFMLVKHKNAKLIEWTRKYKEEFMKSNVQTVTGFIDSQLNYLASGRNDNIYRVGRLQELCNGVASHNYQESATFVKHNDYTSVTLCLTYLSIKGYRPTVKRDNLKFTKCDTPLLIGTGNKYIDLYDYYYACTPLTQEEIPDWTNVPTMSVEFIKYFTGQKK